MKQIVVLGGGTGTTATLSGLKQYDDLRLSIIVNMVDDGGSNRVVRDEFGLLPLSDLRKSIIALAPTGNAILRQLFTFRFSKGDGLKGHTLGNLMMIGLSESLGGEVPAIEALKTLFQVKGNVFPASLTKAHLVATYDDGSTIIGEHDIDEPADDKDRKIVQLSLSPTGEAYSPALDALKTADVIIAGPGDLYTTTLAAMIVPGMKERIQTAGGRFVFIVNIMTKKGQTHWMKASDFVKEIAVYAGRGPDVVVMHAGDLPQEAVKAYAEKEEFPIVDDLVEGAGYEIVRADIVANEQVKRDSGDTLVRSLVRHDEYKLGRVLYQIINGS
jgi:uncharacterized cofD-like protein